MKGFRLPAWVWEPADQGQAGERRDFLMRLVGLTGCFVIPAGSWAADRPGDVVEVGDFRRLSVDLPAEVRYDVAAPGKAGRVTIEAPPRVRAGIGVRVADATLIVEATGSWSSDRPVRITIEGPADLAAATVGGSTEVVLAGLKAAAFDLVAEGSSVILIDEGRWQSLAVRIADSARVRGRGEADRLRVQVDDAGEWEGARFPGDRVEVRTDGSGRAEVQGRQSIQASAAGASSVVTGGPARVSRHVEDAATIDDRG